MRLTLMEANVEASLFIKTILLIASTFNVFIYINTGHFGQVVVVY